MLYPALELPTYGAQVPVGTSLEEVHEDAQGVGALLLCRQAERAGAAPPGETKASVRLYSTFQYLKGA